MSVQHVLLSSMGAAGPRETVYTGASLEGRVKEVTSRFSAFAWSMTQRGFCKGQARKFPNGSSNFQPAKSSDGRTVVPSSLRRGSWWSAPSPKLS